MRHLQGACAARHVLHGMRCDSQRVLRGRCRACRVMCGVRAWRARAACDACSARGVRGRGMGARAPSRRAPARILAPPTGPHRANESPVSYTHLTLPTICSV
eukprot:220745-Prymnesium_polylepis.1